MAPETNWILISKNEPLDPGDRIRMYYSIIGPTYMVAAQTAAIENKLESDPRFTLIASSLPKGEGWVKDIWFEILVKTPKQQTPQTPGVQQASVTGAVIAVAVAVAVSFGGLWVWLSFKEIRRMDIGPEAVGEVIKETGWTAVKVAAAAIIGVIALKWWKG